MTMVSSGPISLGGTATTSGLNQSINVELGYSGTAQISLNDAAVRALLGKASGAISLNDAYGKSNTFSFTISSNQTNANLRTLAVNAGWNQSSKVIATIASGVYCSSNSTGTPGLTINGSFPSGVDLINGGFIIGMGGNGGAGSGGSGSSSVAGSAGAAGGLALSVSVAVSITNNKTLGGGGGGGGGGRTGIYTYVDGNKDSRLACVGGGGGGGGRSGVAANSSGGAGGPATGQDSSYPGSAGSSGTSSAAGGGGAGGVGIVSVTGGAGGAGGGWGSAGSTGGNTSGLTSNTRPGPYSGGSGGGAITGNSNITWVAFGTRLGSIT